MNKIVYTFLVIIFALIISCKNNAPDPQEWAISNGTKNLKFKLSLQNSKLSYTIVYEVDNNKETTVIGSSPLGLKRSDADFSQGFTFVSVSEAKPVDETYTMIVGKQSEIKNQYLEQVFGFQNEKGIKMNIVVRAYPDGFAFSYAFPEKSDNILKIMAEFTGFRMPYGKAWMLPYSKVDTWAPAYEAIWENKTDVGKTSPDSVGWSLPALFNVNDLWVMITEAGLDTTYYGVHLEQKPDSGLYKVRLPETNETYGFAEQPATISLPWQSAWRIIIIGQTPKKIMESNMVYNVSKPCELKDISWIKPGRVSWSWWSDMGSPYEYNKIVPFIDLSAKLGWEYSLIDLGWQEMKNGGDIQKLTAYARSKGVGLILWYNSAGKHTKVPNACPCDLMSDPIKRTEEMKKLQSWGIKGIKVDFFQSDKQWVIKLYHDILIDAAKYNLFVDFHGSTIPRGWSRTYPNLLSMEAIRGAEQYWDTVFAENAHTYHTIYTFTRNVIGPMDYTPVIFSFPKGRVPHQTTNSHELATSVAFESGLQHFADDAKAYLATPQYVQDFLKVVPVTWDETLYLDGTPGDLTLMARRKSADWYIACLNGQKTKKTITVPLSFVGDGDFTANIIKDGKDQQSFVNEIVTVKKGSEVKVEVAERGGFTIRIIKK